MATTEVKRGHLGVRGKWMVSSFADCMGLTYCDQWRDRDVVLATTGEFLVYRKGTSTLKMKIHLWDPDVKITFHADDALLALKTRCSERDLVFDCKSTKERDGWLTAIYGVQAKTPAAAHVDEDSDSDSDENFQIYADETETLAAFQHVRQSIVCALGMEEDVVDLCDPEPPTDTEHAKHWHALAAFIEHVESGGRSVLLHWEQLSALPIGLTMATLLTTIGERNKQTATATAVTPGSRPRKTSSSQKTLVTAFVRDLLFHSLYGARLGAPGSDELAANVRLIDKYFPHCRLRRFSNLDDSDVPVVVAAAHVEAPPPTVSVRLANQRGTRHIIVASDKAVSTESRRQRVEGSPLGALQTLRAVLRAFDMTPEAFAHQCTLYHRAQLGNLPVWTFLGPATPAQRALTNHFNKLTAYLVWSVVAEEGPGDRAHVIEAITSIAVAAHGCSNFHLVMACIGCLGDAPLMQSRLPLTWKRVRAKSKAQLFELRSLCDHNGGFDTLRKKQHLLSGSAATLPFLGVVGAALERLRATPLLANGKIDVDKLERQYDALKVVENALNHQYVWEADASAKAFLEKLPVHAAFIVPTGLHQRSLQLQAWETMPFRVPSFGDTPGRRGSKAAEGSRVLPYTHACALLRTVASAGDRIRLFVELLVLSDKTPVAKIVRGLWADVHESLFTTTTDATCSILRKGLAAVVDASRTHCGSECTELAANEATVDVLLYESVVRSVVPPVATGLIAKLQAECASAEQTDAPGHHLDAPTSPVHALEQLTAAGDPLEPALRHIVQQMRHPKALHMFVAKIIEPKKLRDELRATLTVYASCLTSQGVATIS
ncbi:hypothetical protein ACHHYP_14818 [Achlya hypogyna]|uniref:Ras-GEF domain-containing protein n=1 Tax=Achlya hypogyna TaxID=1202772 RepID=A0A1V9YCB9_ACHHY|nr:hypothetical protein ACHHYP_14818 [Achlya hypogyna]